MPGLPVRLAFADKGMQKAHACDVGLRDGDVHSPTCPRAGSLTSPSAEAGLTRVESPQTPQEEGEAIHDRAFGDHVAAQVATDFLSRPRVASQAAGTLDRPAPVQHSPVGPAAAGRGGRTVLWTA